MTLLPFLGSRLSGLDEMVYFFIFFFKLFYELDTTSTELYLEGGVDPKQIVPSVFPKKNDPGNFLLFYM
jgi:hypothetical protein